MDTIWVIEQGEYSDYRVVGVYSSRENAEVVCKAINDRRPCYQAEISEWRFNPGTTEINQGMRIYSVRMLRDGSVEEVKSHEFSGFDIGGEVRLWRRKSAPYWRGKDVEDCLCVTCWATDDRHAVKIANEHRSQWIAMGKWPESK